MSRYFALSEMLRSETATRKHIANTPSHDVCQRINYLLDHTLDPVRELWGKPIGVNSGYRSEALNAAVGGVRTSQHTSGEAADITTGSADGNRRLFDAIAESNIDFDQCIDESYYKWIHISCRFNSSGNRRQILHL